MGEALGAPVGCEVRRLGWLAWRFYRWQWRTGRLKFTLENYPDEGGPGGPIRELTKPGPGLGVSWATH